MIKVSGTALVINYHTVHLPADQTAKIKDNLVISYVRFKGGMSWPKVSSFVFIF